MITEAQLLRHICAHPEDDLARLVYADWLEENAIEVQCGTCVGNLGHIHVDGADRFALPANAISTSQFHETRHEPWRQQYRTHWAKCPTCHGTGTISDGRRDRAEFVRVQFELAKECGRCEGTGKAYGADRSFEWHDRDDYGKCPVCWPLRRRERELLQAHWTRWTAEIPLPKCCVNLKKTTDRSTDDDSLVTFRRGFVSHIACPAAVWLEYGVAIVASQPVEHVTLTDRRPWTIGGSDRVDWFRADIVGLGSPDGVPSEWLEYLKNPKAKVLLYCSAIEAHADLNRAALAWARSLAFGPDTPPLASAGRGALPSAVGSD